MPASDLDTAKSLLRSALPSLYNGYRNNLLYDTIKKFLLRPTKHENCTCEVYNVHENRGSIVIDKNCPYHARLIGELDRA